MHKFLKLIFGIELYTFRTVSLSIIRSHQFVITHSVGAIQPLCVRVPESYITKFSLPPVLQGPSTGQITS